MEEKNIQVQINEMNRKLDQVLEYIEYQSRKREEFDDLVEDVSIVAKDAMKQSVLILDKAQVELDSCGISCLLVKLLQNIGTFYELLEMMESARDFMKDVSPILHQVGLDAVHKMNELDKKGYFEFLRALGRIMDKLVQSFHPEDLKRIEGNIDNLVSIIRNMTDPDFIASVSKATYALSITKPDDKLDSKSMWQIIKEIRSPEVRRSLSYSIRLLKTMQS